MKRYIFQADLQRELADALREIDRLRDTLTATENVLREIEVIAAPLWTWMPAKDGWYEYFGDIAGIAESALGESFTEAQAVLAAARVVVSADRPEEP